MSVGILALQGDFEEHAQKLAALDEAWIELRSAEDLTKPFDRLILPGGESTTQGKLLRELGMLEALRALIVKGMPVLGTCAGLILLAQDVAGEQAHLATLPVRVKRNAYGRQLESFRVHAPFATTLVREASGATGASGVSGTSPVAPVNAPGKISAATSATTGAIASTTRTKAPQVPMTFIRAPYIESVLSDECDVLAQVEGNIVGVQYRNQIGVSFHPELDADNTVFELFLSL